MDVYKVSNQNKLDVINNTSFKTEKEIQNLVENNLDTLFNLTFVKTEVVCEQFRFDTLCWDEENKSFTFTSSNYKENYRHKLTKKSDISYVMFCLKQKYESMK